MKSNVFSKALLNNMYVLLYGGENPPGTQLLEALKITGELHQAFIGQRVPGTALASQAL